MTKAWWLAVPVMLVLVAPFPVVAAFVAATSSSEQRCAPHAAPVTAGAGVASELMLAGVSLGAPDPGNLTDEQIRNAVTIGHIVLDEVHAPVRALEIAIATAIQESRLRNLNYGDRDSAGLFQQRPSAGWGTFQQVTNPRLATLAFLGRATHTSNRGLLDIVGWAQLPLTVAAQAVQVSAYPDAYAQWQEPARRIAAILAHGRPGQGSEGCPAGPTTSVDAANAAPVDGACPATSSPAEAGLTPFALQVLRCVDERFGHHVYGGVGQRPSNPTSDHPAGRAVDIMIANWAAPAGRTHGDAVAAWVQANASQLHVSYVIWRARIWSPARAAEGWRTYTHPSGAPDPTSMHLDHVHVSVLP